MPQNVSSPPDLYLDAARDAGGSAVPRTTRPRPTAEQPESPAAGGSTGSAIGPDCVTRSTPPAGAERAERAEPTKRTYQIRPDQERALGIALARQQLGQGRAHGEDRSQIIQALLDLRGYNAGYFEGKPIR